jgi:hypothetical protein
MGIFPKIVQRGFNLVSGKSETFSQRDRSGLVIQSQQYDIDHNELNKKPSGAYQRVKAP